MSKSNVVIIMADQLRKDFVNAKTTPRIMELFSESTVFENAYCACPLCAPARGAFFTGLYPNESGSIINPWEPIDRHHGMVKKDTKNLYTMMENEWDSWHTGKQHLFYEDSLQERAETKTKWQTIEKEYWEFLKENNKRAPGGEAFKGNCPEMTQGKATQMRKYSKPTTGCYEEGLKYFFDGFTCDKSVEAIENRDKSKPFLLNAMFLAPHPPLDIPKPYFGMYDDLEISDNVGVRFPEQSPLQLYAMPGFFGAQYSVEQWKDIWNVYGGLVTLLDDAVGKIIDTLKSEGMYDDTIILFSADHGEMLGSHGMWQKMCMYEEATHIPLAIKLPKGEKQISKTNQLISHIDIMPTLCEILEMDKPEKLSGVSLVNVMKDDSPIEREAFCIQYDGNGARGNFQRAVIYENYKLIVDIFQEEVFYELYHLDNDPLEKTNLALDEADICKKLDKMIRKHMIDTDDLITYKPNAYEDFVTNYKPLLRK